METLEEHIFILDLDEIKKYKQSSIKFLLYPIDNKKINNINLNIKFHFNELNLISLTSYLPEQIYLIPDNINLLFIKDVNNDNNKINIVIKSNIQPTNNTYFFIKNVLLNKHEFNNEITNYISKLKINNNIYSLNIYYINSIKPLKYYVHYILNQIDNKIIGGNSISYYYNQIKNKYF